jgi:23S rRNA pseudouridine2605 synthase
VELDGHPVAPEASEVWALNKPAGVTSTAREPGRRRAVVELVSSRARLYPVGRLDADSTGLILLTNDGELANRLTHPRYGVEKSYRVTLRRPPQEAELERLRRGVELDDGPTAPARVRRLSPRAIEVTLSEGRNRQVRRMVEAVGNSAVRLKRVRIGSLRLGALREGDSRRLHPSEIERLWKDARPMKPRGEQAGRRRPGVPGRTRRRRSR